MEWWSDELRAVACSQHSVFPPPKPVPLVGRANPAGETKGRSNGGAMASDALMFRESSRPVQLT
jgi:hypothetical protein